MVRFQSRRRIGYSFALFLICCTISFQFSILDFRIRQAAIVCSHFSVLHVCVIGRLSDLAKITDFLNPLTALLANAFCSLTWQGVSGGRRPDTPPAASALVLLKKTDENSLMIVRISRASIRSPRIRSRNGRNFCSFLHVLKRELPLCSPSGSSPSASISFSFDPFHFASIPA